MAGPGAQMVLPLAMGDHASFDNYWAGHNSEVVAAIRGAIQKGEPRMIYLYGPKGSGKSHLLFAAMRFAEEEILANSYVSLSNPMVGSEMLSSLDVQHLVCVDDAGYWSGNADMERALFTLFEQVKQGGGQLIVAAGQPPTACGFKLADLISRLGSGLVYPVLELNDEQRYEAIKLRVQCRGLSISDDTIKYLLSRAARDSHELFLILDEIDRASLIEKRRVTIPFLQGVLAQRQARHKAES